jgi:hypothetical protein
MTKITTMTRPVTAISGMAARLSFGATVLFVLLLAALHILKPELDPSWRFISEYAIGEYGWMMVLAFFFLALSYVMLFIALRSQIQSIIGKVGLGLLLVSAAGLTIAGIFTTDPITTSREAMTTEGNLHSLGGTLGFAMPFASAFISWGLSRLRDWTPARRKLFWSAGLALIGFFVSFLWLGAMLSQSGGHFGPGVLVGWPTRFEMLGYCVWLMVVARQAGRLSENQGQ